jgi:hypothetical protein
MLNCPYCPRKWATSQMLSMHMRRTHTGEWKGTMLGSIPEGFDLGTPDPHAKAEWEERVKAGVDKGAKAEEERKAIARARQAEWYANLTPEKRQARVEYQKQRRRAKAIQQQGMPRLGKSRFATYYATLSPEQKAARIQRNMELQRARSKYGCSYCAFGTNSEMGLRRHMNSRHPNQTGMVEMRQGRSEQTTTDNNTDKALVDRIVQTVATMIYRDMKGKE